MELKLNAFIFEVDFETSILIIQNTLNDEDFDKIKKAHSDYRKMMSSIDYLDEKQVKKFNLLDESIKNMYRLYKNDLIIIQSDSSIKVLIGLENIERITVV